MDGMETREQTIAKIEFYIKRLSDRQLRMVSGFIQGLLKAARDEKGVKA